MRRTTTSAPTEQTTTSAPTESTTIATAPPDGPTAHEALAEAIALSILAADDDFSNLVTAVDQASCIGSRTVSAEIACRL